MRPSGEPRPEPLRLPGAGILTLPDTITRDDIPALCRCLRTVLLFDSHRMICCDAGALIHPDLVAIDALARLQLTAHRLGAEIVLTGASDDLKELLSLAGLDGVLPTRLGSPIHPIGQAEQREIPRGVQEEREPTDPAI